jgi:hypothetical protein
MSRLTWACDLHILQNSYFCWFITESQEFLFKLKIHFMDFSLFYKIFYTELSSSLGLVSGRSAMILIFLVQEWRNSPLSRYFAKILILKSNTFFAMAVTNGNWVNRIYSWAPNND